MRSFLLTRGLLAALVVTLLLLGGFARPDTRTTLAAAADSSAKTITVTGQGQIMRTPDLATVHLGVQTTGRTAQQAMEKNGAAMIDMSGSSLGFPQGIPESTDGLNLLNS